MLSLRPPPPLCYPSKKPRSLINEGRAKTPPPEDEEWDSSSSPPSFSSSSIIPCFPFSASSSPLSLLLLLASSSSSSSCSSSSLLLLPHYRVCRSGEKGGEEAVAAETLAFPGPKNMCVFLRAGSRSSIVSGEISSESPLLPFSLLSSMCYSSYSHLSSRSSHHCGCDLWLRRCGS